ncbi:hypothetical protein [Pygmaiobacter massiliensis]|uniref:hypothetical protein n=1 Tax=Pygmaiobacter massiliensis TaxID=1917873 RepID=UPI0028A108A3|nr:hypothetical protein [Pygmaiobacter massiliensis]
MSSFALWFDNNKTISDFKADVHFNLWNLHKYKSQPPCLDVGIKLYNPAGYSKIFFYIPFIIEKSDLEDLGQYLKETATLCTVFNDDYTIEQQAQSKILKVENANDRTTMNIYCLDISNDVILEQKFDGTLISFSRPKLLEVSNEIEYYRFRINNNCLNKIIKRYSPKNLFLQSAFSILEAIDFRFNDYRSLPSSLLEEVREKSNYDISKVHFLLVTEADVDLQFSSITPTARELESNVWNKYYNRLFDNKVVAYHWKFKTEKTDKFIENCIMFVKTRVHRCNFLSIGLYILIAGLLAILFNYISHFLF